MSWNMDINAENHDFMLQIKILLQRPEATGGGGQRGVWGPQALQRSCEPSVQHWDWSVCYDTQAEAGSEEYGGPKPFSEPESRVVRLVAETARPQAYVALHSGEYALYAPWDSEARPSWLWGYSLKLWVPSGEYALYAPWTARRGPLALRLYFQHSEYTLQKPVVRCTQALYAHLSCKARAHIGSAGSACACGWYVLYEHLCGFLKLKGSADHRQSGVAGVA